MAFDFQWTAVSALVAGFTGLATILLYFIRSEIRNETKSIKDLVLLDREVMKMRVDKIESAIDQMQVKVDMANDFKWQLKIIEERSVAHGKRLDNLSVRFNKYADSKAGIDYEGLGAEQSS